MKNFTTFVEKMEFFPTFKNRTLSMRYLCQGKRALLKVLFLLVKQALYNCQNYGHWRNLHANAKVRIYPVSMPEPESMIFFLGYASIFSLQKMLDNIGHSLFFSRRANLFLLYIQKKPEPDLTKIKK